MRSQLQKAPMGLKRSLWSAFAPAEDIPAVLTSRSIRVMPMVAPANHRPGSFGSPNTAEEIANLIDIKDEQIAAVFDAVEVLRISAPVRHGHFSLYVNESRPGTNTGSGKPRKSF